MRELSIALGPRRLTLAVCQWNPGEGTPLVVLHGFLEQGAAWDAVSTRLERTVYAPDQRGHGRSQHVGVGGFYHFWDYVADVDGLLEQISPDAPVDLLGHSMGGTVACLYAGTRPKRVRRLILAEGLGPPDTEADNVQRARQFLHHLREPRSHGAPFEAPEAAAARMRKHNPSLTEANALTLAERLVERSDDGWHWRWDALHRARSPQPFSERQFVRFLEAITAPTLVVYGEESPFPGIERAAFLADAVIERIPGAGHLLHHDQPAALAAHIEAHLKEP